MGESQREQGGENYLTGIEFCKGKLIVPGLNPACFPRRPVFLFYENPKTVCDHIMLGIHAEQRKHDKILPNLNYYNKFGSTLYVSCNTSKPVYATKKSHVNYVVADTESWEQKAAKALEEMQEVICFVKNSFLNFHIPYVMEGKDKKYVPDFILRAKTPSGKTINLILEISRFSQDKDYKTNYVYNRWLPAVNNIREKYEMDEWHFLAVSAEIRNIKAEIREALKKADQIVVVSADVQ